MQKKIVFLFFISFVTSIFSQEPEQLIFGKITDSIGVVENANIINLNNKQGTSSNANGEFKIIVKPGDSLRISSIQYVTKFMLVNQFSIDNNRIDIFLSKGIEELEEFELKRTELLGILGIDQKQVPQERKEALLRETLDFSNVLWDKWDVADYTNTKVKPPMVNTSHGGDVGLGGGATFVMPFKASKKYWALVRELKFKKSFPELVFIDFGAKFFLVDLKIPSERYYHFLEYCNPLGIEDLYKNNKKLAVIKIFKEESVAYLKIINAEKK